MLVNNKLTMELQRDNRLDKQNQIAEWLLGYEWSEGEQYPHNGLAEFIERVKGAGFGLEFKGADTIAEWIRMAG
jgi:hypothetical protein